MNDKERRKTLNFPFSYFTLQTFPKNPSFFPGDCALRAWVLVTHVDPLRAYLFDGGIFESNTKHLTYWQAANEGVLGKAGEKKEGGDKEGHTALGADNEKPTPWALHRLRKFVGDATGKERERGGGRGGVPEPFFFAFRDLFSVLGPENPSQQQQKNDHLHHLQKKKKNRHPQDL